MQAFFNMFFFPINVTDQKVGMYSSRPFIQYFCGNTHKHTDEKSAIKEIR